MYLNCGLKNENLIIAVVRIKPEKYEACAGVERMTCDTGAVLYQLS